MEPSALGAGRPPLESLLPALADGERGAVVWHREHLRTADHPAVAAAAERADVLVPVFVFDPGFYGSDGLACDSRVGFMHDCLADLDRRYAAVGGGLALVHGDPVELLGGVRDAGWEVLAARSPTGRYGRRRDERARKAGVEFVAGDGLVRDTDRTRTNWEERITDWFTGERYDPDLGSVRLAAPETGVSVGDVEAAYDVTPEKELVPPGGRRAALDRLEGFVDRIRSYPGSISSPLSAREGASGLSPYLRFGCLSVREVYQHVHEHAPEGRGREMFTSRLYWNKHYEQKLADWPGWLDEAVNPELRWFNRERHDPELVAAWKEGRTGYPMVDAAMRCLAATGWLNFRMRAMCVSFYFHVLQQPWKLGADWYHHHLIDSEASINYTQWQSQCGLVGKPTLRVYNPRKQVRDQDPEGEWVRRWVPELEGLPAEHLDRPERTPLAVQAECGVRIGGDGDYPRPVVEYEAAIEEFWRRYDAVKPAAAARLGEKEVARRASLSGGLDGARRIAAEHGESEGGTDTDGTGEQADLTAFE
jgi:deoxyribodipyrimidine photo-lyase